MRQPTFVNSPYKPSPLKTRWRRSPRGAPMSTSASSIARSATPCLACPLQRRAHQRIPSLCEPLSHPPKRCASTHSDKAYQFCGESNRPPPVLHAYGQELKIARRPPGHYGRTAGTAVSLSSRSSRPSRSNIPSFPPPIFELFGKISLPTVDPRALHAYELETRNSKPPPALVAARRAGLRYFRNFAASPAVAPSWTMAISARVMPEGLSCWMILRP